MGVYPLTMKLIFKILVLFIGLALAFAVSFYFFGDQTEVIFSRERCVEWFGNQKETAWIWGLVLLVSDILLPIPATGVMAALGAVYGFLPGTCISFTGSFLAGLAGYGAARMPGRRFIQWMATDEEILRFKSFFDRFGGVAVILSRAMPIMPETITILAGFSRMKFLGFSLALAAGTLPVSILFTWMGTGQGVEQPAGILLAVGLPALAWPVFIKLFKL